LIKLLYLFLSFPYRLILVIIDVEFFDANDGSKEPKVTF